MATILPSDTWATSLGKALVPGRASFTSNIRFTAGLAWQVLRYTLREGGRAAVFAYDVLGILLIWDALRWSLTGPSISSLVIARTARVAGKTAQHFFIGPPTSDPRYRRMRAVAGTLVVLPLLAAFVLFGAIPAALLTGAVRHALPLTLGFVLIAFMHVLCYPPFSWFVSPTAMNLVLQSYRIVVLFALWSAVMNGIHNARATWKTARAAYNDIFTAPPQADAPQQSMMIGGQPAQGTQAPGMTGAPLPAGIAPLTAGRGFAGSLEQQLAYLGDFAARAEMALDGRLAAAQAQQQQQRQSPAGAALGQQTTQQPQQQPQLFAPDKTSPSTTVPDSGQTQSAPPQQQVKPQPLSQQQPAAPPSAAPRLGSAAGTRGSDGASGASLTRASSQTQTAESAQTQASNDADAAARRATRKSARQAAPVASIDHPAPASPEATTGARARRRTST